MRKPKHSPILERLRTHALASIKNKSGDPVGEAAAAVASALKALGGLFEGDLLGELAAAVDEPTRADFVAAFEAIRDIANQAITALGGENGKKSDPLPEEVAPSQALSITSTAYGRLSDKERREFLRRGGRIVSTSAPRRWGAKS